MRKVLTLLLITLFVLPLFSQGQNEKIVPAAQQGYKRGLDGLYKWLSNPYFRQVKLGTSVLDSLGRTLMYVQNKNGSALAAGDACVWDNTAIAVADSNTIDNTMACTDLSGEGGYFTILVDFHGTPDAGDSMFVYGTTFEGGASDYSAMAITASADIDMMVLDTTTAAPILHWSDVDSIKFNTDAITDGADSVDVYAYGVSTVIASDGANTDVAGVAVGAIADNAFGYICILGAVEATVDAATTAASPGVLLEGAANGDLVTDAAATTSKNIGRCLEYSNLDNKKIRVFIDCQ